MSSKPRNASRSRRRPWLLPAIIGLVVLLGFGWWWTQRKAGGEESAYRTTQVERGDIRTRTETFAEMWADATHFHVEGRLEAYENDRLILERKVADRIPRDHM